MSAALPAETQRRGLVQTLRDRRVRTKTMVAVAMAGIVALIVAAIGGQSLSQITASAEELYETNLLGVQHVADMRVAVDGMQLSARDALIKTSQEEKKAALAAFEEHFGELEEAGAAFAAAGHDAETEKLGVTLTEAVTAYRDVQVETMAPLALAGDVEEWDRLNSTRVKDITDTMEESFTALATGELEEAAAAVAQIKDDSRATRTTNLVVLVVGLFMASLLAWLIATVLNHSINRVKEVIDALAEGDLTRHADVTNRDEMGLMAIGLNTATAKLRELMRGVVDSADAVASAAVQLSAGSEQIAAAAE